MIGQLLLRLTLWFLLTANFSLANIIIGVCIALLLPHQGISRESWREWLRMVWKVLKAIPQAYIEAVELILRPHQAEEIVMERVRSRRSPGLVFLDIFVITFTPKTIVLNHHKDGSYEVHQVTRRRRSA
ncbi:Na+/H+ antiporter subunit E [Oscillatoria sp. FACHB-1407]|uniref:Na+/H+ antiporter subunit E n=1 Tax=Oscillatoria sp. FACHB-1407 TaxID=2692847 RepID=UPI0016891CDE|nr:Na+/H+ antiporter subunit E [Oscillatoria sp. FACHB-1407]MBD2464679.1 Na+/H+ antiporter subunit E [Oscillatoria sp. FACHB-1407]